MSRSGYTEDHDILALGRWRGRVASAIRGKRGQQFLRDLIDSLEAMPVKELHADIFAEADGRACAMGVAARARGLDAEAIDPEDVEQAAEALNIAYPLACEVAYLNDEIQHGRCWTIGPNHDAAQARWRFMHGWAKDNLRDSRGKGGAR